MDSEVPGGINEASVLGLQTVMSDRHLQFLTNLLQVKQTSYGQVAEFRQLLLLCCY